MAVLVRDKNEAEHCQKQGGAGGSDSSSRANKTPRREVSDVLSWCQCFAIYISVIASKQPESVSQMLAYQAMLVHKA